MRVILLVLSGLCACGPDKLPEDTASSVVDADGDGYPEGEDCDDDDAASSPGASEVCDGLDNDCDGLADESGDGGVPVLYEDQDGDGYGGSHPEVDACTVDASGGGYATVAGDCNDRDAEKYPGATEVCDDKDNNCDQEVDEGFEKQTWYEDGDHDGFGDPETALTTCETPEFLVVDGQDCDDRSPRSHPGASERPDDGEDNDCDGVTDEDIAIDGLRFLDTWESWDDLTITIEGGSGTYTLGFVETWPGYGDSYWSGEDCLYGITDPTDGSHLNYCHPASETGGSYVSVYEALADGTLGFDEIGAYETVFTADQQPLLTFAAWSDETGECWTWGNTPSYYTAAGCTSF